MNTNKFIIILLSFLMLTCRLSSVYGAYNQNYTAPDSAASEVKFEMVQYYFVELIRNPDRPALPDDDVMKIQEGHIANINRLAEEGIILLAGPFGDDKGGGIFIIKAESVEKVYEYLSTDPAIQNKRLNYEVRPWWTGKGVFASEIKNK